MIFTQFATISAIICAMATAVPVQPRARIRSSSIRMRPLLGNSAPSLRSAAAWADSAANGPSDAVATLVVSASVPSVNLEDTHGFINVKCTGNTATARFADTSKIASWSVQPTLLLIAGHHRCGPQGSEQFTMLLAKSWTINNDDKTVVFETADPKENGVTGSYKIVAFPAGKSHPRIFKSSAFANLLAKNDASLMNQMTLPIDIDQTVTDRFEFQIPDTYLKVGAECNQCGITGNTAITFISEGSLFSNSKFAVEWTGKLQTGIDLTLYLKTNETFENQSAQIKLLDVPLSPLSIPGLIEAGPVFVVYGRAEFGIQGSIEVNIQSSATLSNFNASLSTTNGIQVNGFNPVFESSFKPSAALHGHLDFSVIPTLSISASVFGYKLSDDFVKAEIDFVDSNTLDLKNSRTICVKSQVSSKVEASIYSMSPAVFPVMQPYQLFQKCFDLY